MEVDDLILLCRSYKESITHTQLLVDTLHNLGFGIHPDKAQVIPSRLSEFLRTHVNSRKMQPKVFKMINRWYGRTQGTPLQLGPTGCSIVMCHGGPTRRQLPSTHSCSRSRARTRTAAFRSGVPISKCFYVSVSQQGYWLPLPSFGSYRPWCAN